jgi:hypothetical protein
MTDAELERQNAVIPVMQADLVAAEAKLAEARTWIEEESPCLCGGYGMGPPPCRRCKVLAAIDAGKAHKQ